MAQDDNKEEEEDEKHRAEEFLQFRRQFDGMKEKHEGVHSSAEKLKSNGNHFFSLGLYTQATMVYSEALELKPTSTVLLNNRAMAYLKQGMAQEALEDADKSIQVDATQENIKAFWRRAQALLDLERDQDAELAANEGLKLQPNNGHLSRVRRKAREAVTMRSLCGVEWVGKLENGVEKRYEFSKDGTMTMTVIGHPLKATFDLSVENTPQTMVVKMKPFGPGGGAPPPPVPYIYEFHDNDQAVSRSSGYATRSAAMNSPAVLTVLASADCAGQKTRRLLPMATMPRVSPWTSVVRATCKSSMRFFRSCRPSCLNAPPKMRLATRSCSWRKSIN
eukprot:TRINITY_DN19223_c0_g1_i2.p1 TRINITY_DN19223_c0_g1~~TRINITY_DN19223_c0_g1_i2.p1  ORF type:complete len:334 (-),score=57.68 TRINITY_DN19223_c0_g1_i2:281-1282(-)